MKLLEAPKLGTIGVMPSFNLCYRGHKHLFYIIKSQLTLDFGKSAFLCSLGLKFIMIRCKFIFSIKLQMTLQLALLNIKPLYFDFHPNSITSTLYITNETSIFFNIFIWNYLIYHKNIMAIWIILNGLYIEIFELIIYYKLGGFKYNI